MRPLIKSIFEKKPALSISMFTPVRILKAGSRIQKPGQLFLLFNAVFIVFFYGPLRELMHTAWHSEYYSYIPFIPVITAYLLYEKRQLIFSQRESSSPAGMVLAGVALLLFFVAKNREALLDRHDYLSFVTLSMATLWIGAFTLCFGTRSLRGAAFPLSFLFFTVPIPHAVLDQCILFLQSGSAEAAHVLFQAAGVPVARDGFIFHLPTLDIEVAKQCSGIRSSLSLLITSLLAGNIFLRTGWARSLMVISIVPITILKNGLRIFVLSVLGVYVDDKILTQSALHSRGGILFFALALFLVGAVIVMLQKAESRFTPEHP